MYVKDTFGNTPIQEAALDNRWDIVKLFFENGFDSNKKDDSGNNALHRAVHSKLVSLALEFILKRVDVNAKNNEGQSPLDIAHNCCEEDMVSMLKRYGAKTSKELQEEGE